MPGANLPHVRRRAQPALALIVVLGATGLASASCSLLVDTSGLSGGADAVLDGAALADGASNDATGPGETGGGDGGPGTGDASEVDAAEAGVRKNACGALLFGTPLPLFNADFESGCTSGWSVYTGIATEDTSLPAKGAVACHVCNSIGDSADGFFINAAAGQAILPGEIYELVACVRAVPGADGGVATYAELNSGTEGHRGSSVVVGDTYVPVRGALTVGMAHPDLSVAVRVSPALAGDCFVVDDMSLSRVRDASTD